MGLIDTEQFRKNFFKLDTEFRPSQIDAVFDCINNCELVDGVTVIRCKDCEFFQPFEPSTEGMCIYAMTIKNANGFCDFAERKKEE